MDLDTVSCKKELSAITQNTGTFARLTILKIYRDAAFIPRFLFVVCFIFFRLGF